jgi:hypothetical protein
MLLRRLASGSCPVAPPSVVVAAQRPVDAKALVPRGLSTPCGPPVPVAPVGELLADGRPVILALGLRHVGEECRPGAPPRPPPEPGAGGAPPRRIAVGLREPATAEEDGDVLGIDAVMFGLARRDGLPGEGLPEDDRESLPERRGRPARSQGHRHATATTIPPREGATTLREVSGRAFRSRCTRMSPAWLRRQTSIGRAGPSRPQEKGGGVVEKRRRAPPRLGGFSQCQPTTVVCGGGGLKKYHCTGADVAHRATQLESLTGRTKTLSASWSSARQERTHSGSGWRRTQT